MYVWSAPLFIFYSLYPYAFIFFLKNSALSQSKMYIFKKLVLDVIPFHFLLWFRLLHDLLCDAWTTGSGPFFTWLCRAHSAQFRTTVKWYSVECVGEVFHRVPKSFPFEKEDCWSPCKFPKAPVGTNAFPFKNYLQQYEDTNYWSMNVCIPIMRERWLPEVCLPWRCCLICLCMMLFPEVK